MVKNVQKLPYFSKNQVFKLKIFAQWAKKLKNVQKLENVQKLRKLDSILKRSVTRQLDSNSEIKKKSLYTLCQKCLEMFRNSEKLLFSK